jgi:cell division protein ZapA
MSAQVETVRVHLLEKDYQVACPAAEREGLLESARYLDQQMRAIRQGGKVIGVERIAVMAALNIAHELLQLGQNSDRSSQDLEERLRRLSVKLDDTISSYRQMEM